MKPYVEVTLDDFELEDIIDHVESCGYFVSDEKSPDSKSAALAVYEAWGRRDPKADEMARQLIADLAEKVPFYG